MVLPHFAAAAITPTSAPLRVLTLTAGQRWKTGPTTITSSDGIVFKVPGSGATRGLPEGSVNASAQTIHAALTLLKCEVLPPEWRAYPLLERCSRIVALVAFFKEYECFAALESLKVRHGADPRCASPRERPTFPLQAFILGAAAGDTAFCERAIRGNDAAFGADDPLNLERRAGHHFRQLIPSSYWVALARARVSARECANGSAATWATMFRTRVEEASETSEADTLVEVPVETEGVVVAKKGWGSSAILAWAEEVAANVRLAIR